jgi:hypothetical protein
MPATVESPSVREQKPAPALPAPAADQAPALPNSTAPAPAAYWGDRFALRLWLAGASVLAVLHVVDWLGHLLRP